jgi:tight adherence protein C
MILAALLAAGLGAGMWLSARALWPAPRPLRVVAAEVHRPRRQTTVVGGGPVSRWSRRAATRLAGDGSPRLGADLAVTGRSAVQHMLDKLGYALVFAALGAGGAVVLALGGAGTSWPAVAGMALLGGAGFAYPDIELRSAARAARLRWAHALTVYVDVVGISLAGGAGVDDALYGAATAGHGREFGEIAGALHAARTRRRTLWRALDDLGERLDVAALRELAASVELAGETGSRIRETLIAKARAMRAKQLADVEAEAHRATETMGIAPALMALAAVVLIGYPAVARFLET